jgi:hypothetical protein
VKINIAYAVAFKIHEERRSIPYRILLERYVYINLYSLLEDTLDIDDNIYPTSNSPVFIT